MNETNTMITVKGINQAAIRLKGVADRTALQYNRQLSEEFLCNVYLKREDLQVVRSYKLRGAYNKIATLSVEARSRGLVCASAGNHAQGVAYSCQKLGIRGIIFMPATTPSQKIIQVETFGKGNVTIQLTGDTYDDAYNAALAYSNVHDATFVHPFDDDQVIEGQGTVGQEIFEDAGFEIDYLLLPVGGGGLAAGVSVYFKELSPNTKLIGVEPAGAASMQAAFDKGSVVELDQVDKFVDGAAVKRVGERTFRICKESLTRMIAVPEGKVCTTILNLYNLQAIVVEPAGALSIAALQEMRESIKGKNVVCIVSGGNNDFTRMEEIRERSLLYEGLKHYFIVRFPQRAGALKEFLTEILGPQDDIVHFEYIKKNNREKGPALIGIELKDPGDLNLLQLRLKKLEFNHEYLNQQDDLLQFLL